MPTGIESGIESHAIPQHRVEGSRPDVPRPLPPRRVSERVRAWMAWFGVARLLALGATVLLVVVGGYWLLQAPPPPVEASLPFAATTTTAGAGHAGPPSTVAATIAGNSPTTAVSTPVFVHVAGAVVAAGVYELPPGSRVVNAIEAAGGPAPSAALDGLNLAASIVDGQRVYVPVVGEVDLATVDNGPTFADSAALDAASPAVDATPVPVDLNRANSSELEALPGVGPATAAAIIDDRSRNGPFASVDDLDRVSGIGPATLTRLRDLVTV